MMSKQAYERSLIYEVTGLAGGKTAASFDSYGQGVHNVENIIHQEHTHSATVADSGDGQAHDNMPPYYALTYIIKY